MTREERRAELEKLDFNKLIAIRDKLEREKTGKFKGPEIGSVNRHLIEDILEFEYGPE